MLRYCSNKVRDDSAHGAYAESSTRVKQTRDSVALGLDPEPASTPVGPKLKQPSFMRSPVPIPTKDNREPRQPAARLLATPFNFRAEI